MGSQKLWEARVIAATLEASAGLRRLAPIQEGDRIKSRIARAARKAGLSYSRAFEIWYGRARRIGAAELDAIRSAAQTRQDKQDELAALAADFEALADRAARVLAGACRPEADAFRALAGRARRLSGGEG